MKENRTAISDTTTQHACPKKSTKKKNNKERMKQISKCHAKKTQKK